VYATELQEKAEDWTGSRARPHRTDRDM
jgi:hypothetical protein